MNASTWIASKVSRLKPGAGDGDAAAADGAAGKKDKATPDGGRRAMNLRHQSKT